MLMRQLEMQQEAQKQQEQELMRQLQQWKAENQQAQELMRELQTQWKTENQQEQKEKNRFLQTFVFDQTPDKYLLCRENNEECSTFLQNIESCNQNTNKDECLDSLLTQKNMDLIDFSKSTKFQPSSLQTKNQTGDVSQGKLISLIGLLSPYATIISMVILISLITLIIFTYKHFKNRKKQITNIEQEVSVKTDMLKKEELDTPEKKQQVKEQTYLTENQIIKH